MNTKSQGFLWRQRLGLGITEFGRNIGDFMIMTYLMVYLTDVADVPTAAISVMFLICRIFDAFTDYLVGVFVDRTRTKLGRSKPWMYIGSLVLAVGVYMLFHFPIGASAGTLVAYAYAAYLIENFGMTMVAIPEGALIPALSTNAVERTTLASARGIAGGIANLVSANIATFLIQSSADQAKGYGNAALGFAAITILCVCVGISLLREINLPPIENKKVSGSEMLSDLKALFTDRYYLYMMLYGMCVMLCLIPIMSMMVYYLRDVAGAPQIIGVAFSIVSIVPTLASFFVPSVNRKLSKRQCAMLGEIIYLIAYLILWGFRGNLPMMIIALIVWGVGNGFVGTMLWAMQPEVFDHVEYRSGKAQAALPTAIISYACKIGNALAASITAALLAWGHYDGTLQAQAASAKNGILLGYIGLPLLADVVLLIFTYFYDLDKKYPQIRSELDRRHKEEEASEKKGA